MTDFEPLDTIHLAAVTGGTAKPTAAPVDKPAPTPHPTPQPQPHPQQMPPQPPPQPHDDMAWVRNTITCTRIGGPLLGVLCGVLTPTPAN